MKYKVHIGNFVNFENAGIIQFKSRNITVRDFSEIVVYEKGLLQIEDNVFLGKNVEVGAQNIYIGENTSIQNNCILLGNIRIGRNCLFGPSIYISSGFHYFKYRPELLIRDQDALARNELDLNNNGIKIEDDVWIGKDVVIINNVVVGKGAVIGAGTIVNKNVDPYTVIAGSPQRIIGLRLDFERNAPSVLQGDVERDYPYFYSGFDYALSSLRRNKVVAIIDNDFSIYIKNPSNKKFIILELLTTDSISHIKFNRQRFAILPGAMVKFDVTDGTGNRYDFKIEGSISRVLVKKIYFDD